MDQGTKDPGTKDQGPRDIGTVVFVGTGFSLMLHATLEAVGQIEIADKLFHLVAEPAAAYWLKSLNPTAESLAPFYAEGKSRMRAYEEMVERILSHVHRGEHVCVAFYGHPAVGVEPTQMVLRRARAEGFSARILPGISSDACLYADLGIDPMDHGIQAYEASRFVAREPRIDTGTGLILWQAGFVGESSMNFSGRSHGPGVRHLVSILRRYYPASHPVAAYEASPYPIAPSWIAWTRLHSLANAIRSTATTVFIPPVGWSPQPVVSRKGKRSGRRGLPRRRRSPRSSAG